MRGRVTIKHRINNGRIRDDKEQAVRLRHQERMSDSIWLGAVAVAVAIVLGFSTFIWWLVS